jgi:hypothetical protein
MKNRKYYTEFAWVLPKDTITLTAGCAKYRYNKLNLGRNPQSLRCWPVYRFLFSGGNSPIGSTLSLIGRLEDRLIK